MGEDLARDRGSARRPSLLAQAKALRATAQLTTANRRPPARSSKPSSRPQGQAPRPIPPLVPRSNRPSDPAPGSRVHRPVADGKHNGIVERIECRDRPETASVDGAPLGAPNPE